MTADTLADMEEGDHVLYNDKKRPLVVTDVREDRVLVEGPHGGEYMLFRAEDEPDTLLVAKPGNREYASYVEDLRIVGRWQRVDDGRWEHSESGAAIRVEETETGFWTLDVENFDGDVDIPRYGFTERGIAVEEAMKIVRDNPEG